MVEAIREDSKILKKDLISSLIDVKTNSKEKFMKSLERQEERVQNSIDDISTILQDHISKEMLIQAITQFENLQLLLIVNRINENRHLTLNQIAVYFLAVLDNLLALIDEKLSPNLFDILQENMEGLSKGKSFSYNEMKKRQIELIQKGYISKIRKLGYTLKLKDTYCQTVNHMISMYPQHKDKLENMEIDGYSLVHSKSIPKMDVIKSTAVVIGSQIPRYFPDKEDKNLLWSYLESLTSEEEEKIKRRVYRFNSNLQSETDLES